MVLRSWPNWVYMLPITNKKLPNLIRLLTHRPGGGVKILQVTGRASNAAVSRPCEFSLFYAKV